jgi:hypothetical protein
VGWWRRKIKFVRANGLRHWQSKPKKSCSRSELRDEKQKGIKIAFMMYSLAAGKGGKNKKQFARLLQPKL